MLTYLIRRILLIPPTLIGMTAIVFFVLAMAPGGIGANLLSRTGEMRPEERKVREEYLNRRYGLDRPKYIQYLHWLNKVSPIGFATYTTEDPRVAEAAAEQARERAPIEKQLDEFRAEQAKLRTKPPNQADSARLIEVTNRIAQVDEQRKAIRISPQPGDVMLSHPRLKSIDLGDSFIRGRPVNALVFEALPVTMMLQMIALPLSYAMAIWLGIQQARRRGSTFDYVVSGTTLALWSVPSIWVGVLLIGFLSNQEYLRWFPTTGLNDINETAMQFLPTAGALGGYVGFAAYVIFHAVAIISLIVAAISLVGLLINATRGSRHLVPKLIDLIIVAGIVFLVSAVFVNRLPFPKAVQVVLLVAIVAIAFMARLRYRTLGNLRESSLLAARWISNLCVASGVLLLLSIVGATPPQAAPGIEGGWLFDRLYHIVLPIICLTYTNFAFLSRLARGALLDNIYSDFVRTARAKGLSERVVLYRHAFRNSLIPLINVVVNLLPAMIAGSVVVENIFSINGMGKLAVDAAFQRDFELLLSITFVAAVLELTGYLLADLGFAIADPRVSYG